MRLRAMPPALLRALRPALALVLLLAVAGLAAGCGGAGVPDGEPGIEGVITQAGDGWVLVEENPAEAAGSAKARIAITDSTRLLRQRGSAVEPATAADLAVGGRVRAWFTGPVLESYPVQATASALLILEG